MICLTGCENLISNCDILYDHKIYSKTVKIYCYFVGYIVSTLTLFSMGGERGAKMPVCYDEKETRLRSEVFTWEDFFPL